MCQGYGFSSGHVWMWELDYKEIWALKNWCFWTVVLEKTLESPLDCKEIPPVHPKGDQSWVFIGRTDAEAETWILWPPDVKSWLTGKDPDAGKDWGQEKKGTTEDESSKESYMTEQLNWTELSWTDRDSWSILNKHLFMLWLKKWSSFLSKQIPSCFNTISSLNYHVENQLNMYIFS